ASRALARPVLFLNDADAAGLAEMRFGSGRGCTGTVVMLTFGTGIGTALFTGGKLFPNSELGHLELHGMDAEKWASAQVRSAQGLDFSAWSARVNDYLLAMHKLLWPDVFILGGAVSERFAEFAPLLRSPAALRERIAAKLLAVYGLSVDAESEITITLGATEAIFSAVQAVIGAGDEAIAFDPAYDSYEPAVRLAGGRCVRLPLAQPGFRYDW